MSARMGRGAAAIAVMAMALGTGQPAAAGTAPGERALKQCLRERAPVKCLRDLTRPRAQAQPIKDCLRGDDRLACVGRLLVAPPRPERLVTVYPQLPPSITAARFPSFTADGKRLLAAAESTEFTGTQIVSFARRGGDFRCLTCASWTGAALSKPFAFADGRRILVRIGEQTPFSSADHGVVECAPSVRDCRRAAVLPITLPGGDDANVTQDQRELRIAPDGRHVGFTQVRETASGFPDGVGIVGRLVRGSEGYSVAEPRVVAAGGELKNFTPDGRSVLFARYTNAFEAANADDVIIDLKTGAERRATYAGDWDEDIDAGPAEFRNREWHVVGSGRGSGLIETLGQIRRPTAIEYGTHGLNFSTFGNPAVAEPWLVDEYEARGGYLGQPLAPGAVASGWDSRATTAWSPLGNRITFWQREIGGEATRVVVVTLARRKPVEPRSHKTPRAKWAPPLTGFVPPDKPVPVSRDGRFGGRLEVQVRPSDHPDYTQFIEVRYVDFADERGFVLNGVETSHFNAPTIYGGEALYEADVTVSGKHAGFLRADGVVLGGGEPSGAITSELDGRALRFEPGQ